MTIPSTFCPDSESSAGFYNSGTHAKEEDALFTSPGKNGIDKVQVRHQLTRSKMAAKCDTQLLSTQRLL